MTTRLLRPAPGQPVAGKRGLITIPGTCLPAFAAVRGM